MAAIISEKFRIFNAKQFLESLTEGSSDTGADRSRMYFFVGRPQAWDSYLEVYATDGGSFTAGNQVYVGAGTIIDIDCIIEDNVTIGDNVTITAGSHIQKGTTIESGTTL